MQVTVLGASGLLGTAVVRQLANRPIGLRVLGRRPTGIPADCRADVEVRTADLTAPGEMARAVADADAVIHLAAHTTGVGAWRSAEDDSAAERVNVGLVHDLIDTIRTRRPGHPPIVLFAGSTSQVGRPPSAWLNGTEPDNPQTAYDRQKLAAERAIEAATAEGVIRGTTLRLSTLFSQDNNPGVLDRGVAAAMTRRALAGEPLTMWHDGAVRRDLLCVDDAAGAFVSALDYPDTLAGRHWVVGTGRATTIADLFGTIAELVAECTGTAPVPVLSVQPPSESVPTDQVDFLTDPTAFRTVTGWSAQVPLRQALERLAKSLAR